MTSNMDRYRKDLDELIKRGTQLDIALGYACETKLYREIWEEKFTEDLAKNKLDPSALKLAVEELLAKRISLLPNFKKVYQEWYSEAKALIRQVIPDRLEDFVRHYEKPKRKDLTNENYVIEDYLQGLSVTRGEQVLAGPGAAVARFSQQLAILSAAKTRFHSSLFEIRQLVQADLLDSELDAAAELAKHKFNRAAGAVSGVVLEHHLAQVCDNHSIKLVKKNPTIADLNDALKAASVIDVATWRFIQHLGDIRNLCDHNKKVEPTAQQVNDLIAGVAKISKTLA
jgi:hypothetical protein